MELELLIKVVYIYIIKRDKKIIKKDKERLFQSLLYVWERWLSGLKRRIANPLYELFVPRVRIPLFPFPLMN
jgi:hypothetical protein